MKRRLWVLPIGVLGLSSLGWAERLHVPEGTPVHVRLKADLTTAQATRGNRVDFEVSQPVLVGGRLVIPAGAIAWGAVQVVKPDKEVRFDIESVRLPSLKELRLRTIRVKSKNPGKDEIKADARLAAGIGAAKGTEFTAFLDEAADVETQDSAVPAPAAVAAKPVTTVAPAAEPAPATETNPPPSPISAPPPGGATESIAPAAPPAPAAATTPAAKPAPEPEPPTVPGATTAAPAVKSTQVSQSVAAPQVSNPPAPKPATPTPAAPPAPVSLTPTTSAQDWTNVSEWITVECYSEPFGADILIDGDFVGDTPSILKVPVGNHRLELKLEGYRTISEPLNLPPATPIRTIRKDLEKKE